MQTKREKSVRSGPFRFLAFALCFFQTIPTLACSTVALWAQGEPEMQGRPVVAYNFDYAPTGEGFLIVNPSGVGRSSIMDGRTARWVSRFGSVTFNQVGPGMPAAGMNTAGLVVSLMWNEDAVYEEVGRAAIVNELEFIQWMLDTAGTVDAVLDRLNLIGVSGRVPIHYFVADRSGAAAAITPGAGGLTVHSGARLPVPVLTNTSYAEAIDHLNQIQRSGFGKLSSSGSWHASDSSLSRFVRAAQDVQRGVVLAEPSEAFKVLEKVANPATRWRIVFDPVGQSILVRTEKLERTLNIPLSSLDFSCRVPPLARHVAALPQSDLATSLSPIEHDDLARGIRSVFASMKSTKAMASPDISAAIAAGLLASATCVP